MQDKLGLPCAARLESTQKNFKKSMYKFFNLWYNIIVNEIKEEITMERAQAWQLDMATNFVLTQLYAEGKFNKFKKYVLENTKLTNVLLDRFEASGKLLPNEFFAEINKVIDILITFL